MRISSAFYAETELHPRMRKEPALHALASTALRSVHELGDNGYLQLIQWPSVACRRRRGERSHDRTLLDYRGLYT